MSPPSQRAERIGNCELYYGDALAWLAQQPDASADCLITDPPYSSGGATAGARKRNPSSKYVQVGQAKQWADFSGDTKDQRAQLRWMLLWLGECHRVLRENSPVCLFSDWRQLPLTTDALQCAGFVWRGILVWDKTLASRPVLGRPRAQAEYVVWGSKGSMPTSRKAPVLPGVIRVGVRQADKHHMTGKPTELMRQLVKICERDETGSGLILDPFAGSGTTLVAATQEGYRSMGCELSEHYFDVAVKRIKEAVEAPQT